MALAAYPLFLNSFDLLVDVESSWKGLEVEDTLA